MMETRINSGTKIIANTRTTNIEQGKAPGVKCAWDRSDEDADKHNGQDNKEGEDDTDATMARMMYENDDKQRDEKNHEDEDHC